MGALPTQEPSALGAGRVRTGKELGAMEAAGQQRNFDTGRNMMDKYWGDVFAGMVSRRLFWYKQGGLKPRFKSAGNTVYGSVLKYAYIGAGAEQGSEGK